MPSYGRLDENPKGSRRLSAEADEHSSSGSEGRLRAEFRGSSDDYRRGRSRIGMAELQRGNPEERGATDDAKLANETHRLRDLESEPREG